MGKNFEKSKEEKEKQAKREKSQDDGDKKCIIPSSEDNEIKENMQKCSNEASGSTKKHRKTSRREHKGHLSKATMQENSEVTKSDQPSGRDEKDSQSVQQEQCSEQEKKANHRKKTDSTTKEQEDEESKRVSAEQKDEKKRHNSKNKVHNADYAQSQQINEPNHVEGAKRKKHSKHKKKQGSEAEAQQGERLSIADQTVNANEQKAEGQDIQGTNVSVESKEEGASSGTDAVTRNQAKDEAELETPLGEHKNVTSEQVNEKASEERAKGSPGESSRLERNDTKRRQKHKHKHNKQE